MKDQKTTQQVSTKAMSLEAELLRDEITKEHEAFCEQDAPLIGSCNARLTPSLPRETDTSLAPYIHKIMMVYKSLADKVSSTLHGTNQLMYGKIAMAKLNEEIEIKTKLKDGLNKEREFLLDDKKKQSYKMHHEPIDNIKNYNTLLLCLDIISVSAACLNVFQEAPILGLLLGITIGLGLYILLKMVVVDIRDNVQSFTRKTIKWSVVTLVFLLAISLGIMRAQGSDENHIAQNASILTLINIIVFGATAYVMYRYEPSKADKKELQKYESIERDIEDKNASIKELDNEIKLLNDEKNKVGLKHLQIRYDQKQLNATIKNYYHIAVSIYMEHNLRHRTDGVFPQCFNSIPDLEINNEDETN